MIHARDLGASFGDAIGIEFALPWSYVTGDPQGVGFPTVGASAPDNLVQIRSMQAFGYSFVSGPSFGEDRFGTFANPVPEPGTLAVLGMGALVALRRRRTR